MSLRWPLKSTRGFSATPRRRSTGAFVRPAAQPSRSFARKVVRKAGPQEKAFWTNSTQVDPEFIPSTYMNAAVRYSMNDFPIFTAADYSSMVGSRERLKINRMDVNINTLCVRGDSEAPFVAWSYWTLAAGTPDDLSDDLLAIQAVPFGVQSNVLQFQDQERGVRQRARRRKNFIIPGISYQDPGVDANTFNLAQYDGRRAQSFKLTLRNFWLREPDEIRLVCYHQKTSLNGSGVENANLSGAVVGWHETYVRYAAF